MVEEERSRIPFVRFVQTVRILHATLSGKPELVGKLADKFGMSHEDRMGYIQDATNIHYRVGEGTSQKSIEH